MPHTATDDAGLLAATATDPDAFAAFYDRYEKPVLVYMLRRTRSADLAADLTAEVFASALAGAPRFRYNGAPPAAWLFGIARNVLADSYRAAMVQDAARKRLGMSPMTLTDEMADHLDRLADQSRGKDALELLSHLTPGQISAVAAHVLNDQDYSAIAAELRCSESVVRKRVSRGLAVLRRQLSTGENHA